MNEEDVADAAPLPVRRSAVVAGLFAARVGAVVTAVANGILLGAVVAVVFMPGLALLLGFVGFVLLTVGLRLVRLFQTKKTTTLEVANGALLVGAGARPRRISLAAMRSGQVTPAADGAGARVVVRDLGGVVLDAHLPTSADGRGLLRDLGLSARERPATFAFFFGMRVTVGADGILVAWPLLRRRRFVRYADIAGVLAVPGRIDIRLTDGRDYEIVTTTSGNSDAIARHHALLERIDDACEVYRADQENGPSLATTLARSGRSPLAWVKELSLLSESGGSGYRAATLPKETLWRIALDPTEPEELRIGASLTLRNDLDDAGRARLLSAAEASASPRVRVVLASAAEGLDDDALGDAIAGRVLHGVPDRGRGE